MMGLKTLPNQIDIMSIDCSTLSKLDQPALYQILLEEIEEALAEPASPVSGLSLLAESDPMTCRAFERAIRELTRQGWRPILLLDEFEWLSRNSHLDPDFFSGLRALAAKYPLAYVTASKQPLLALTYAEASALSSPFFNIFANIRLGLLAEAEARLLLTHLAAKGGQTLAPAIIDFMLALAGPHPLLLQIARVPCF
jgi:hypothetical protein